MWSSGSVRLKLNPDNYLSKEFIKYYVKLELELEKVKFVIFILNEFDMVR